MKITINGLEWAFHAVRRNHKKLKTGVLGRCYFADLQIYVDKSLSRGLFRQTVIHELVHACTFSYGVHLAADEKSEESVCDFVGAHLDEICELTDKIMAECYEGD